MGTSQEKNVKENLRTKGPFTVDYHGCQRPRSPEPSAKHLCCLVRAPKKRVEEAIAALWTGHESGGFSSGRPCTEACGSAELPGIAKEKGAPKPRPRPRAPAQAHVRFLLLRDSTIATALGTKPEPRLRYSLPLPVVCDNASVEVLSRAVWIATKKWKNLLATVLGKRDAAQGPLPAS
jgi:hypothetical protein